MEDGPHRKFTSIERKAAPAFSESRAANRPDAVDEVSHDRASMPEFVRGSHINATYLREDASITRGSRFISGGCCHPAIAKYAVYSNIPLR